MSKQIIRGNELQLFINDEAPCWATSHTLTLGTETASVNTKDHGLTQSNTVTGLTWELSGEFLYSTTDVDMFVDLQLAAQPIQIMFSKVSNFSTAGLTRAGGDTSAWLPSPIRLTGNAYISNITANAAAGDNATYTVTFTGTSSLKNSAPINDYVRTYMTFDPEEPRLFAVANANANVEIMDAVTGDAIPVTVQGGVYMYNGRTLMEDKEVIIQMDGTYFTTMYAYIANDLYINITTVPDFTWLDLRTQQVRIIFGNAVTALSDDAFNDLPSDGYTGVRKVFEFTTTTPPTYGQASFGNSATITYIVVPDGTLEVYEDAYQHYGTIDFYEKSDEPSSVHSLGGTNETPEPEPEAEPEEQEP